MTKFLFGTAFITGALAILWIGGIFLGVDSLGLGVTILIAGVYGIGTLELVQFRSATGSLKQALAELAEPVDDFYQWLLNIDPSLQNAVRLRVEGERNGLPSPVVTPYLVGLLVMLGLLGTFIGMVDTLKGAVVALEGSNELEAIRAGLAAPIEGLGLAFGTSVAGVAASAALGLLSTISRRERLQASHMLDTQIGDSLRQFSTSHQQQKAYQAMQDQAQALPVIAEQLSELANRLEQMNDNSNERLLASQVQFQDNAAEGYRKLHESLDQSMKASLADNAELIASSVQPLAEKTMHELNSSALATQQHLTQLNEQQLIVATEASETNNAAILGALEASLEKQSQSTESLVQVINSAIANASSELHSNSKTVLESFATNSDQLGEQQRKQALQFNETISEQLLTLRTDESQRGDAAIERLSELESVVTTHLAALGSALEAPMARLIETASQTPKAAADVIEKLRGEMTKNIERDNTLLSERASLMEQITRLSKTVEESSKDQRNAIDTLVKQSGEALNQVGEQFNQQLESKLSNLTTMVGHFSTSSTEMASLSDSFDAAVTMFSESNTLLIENLSRIEASLEKNTNRSDEQLAYYVAQAREIIDHNLLSHKEIIDGMRAQQHSADKRVG